MRASFAVLVLAAVLAAAFVTAATAAPSALSEEEAAVYLPQFEAFKQQFSKAYADANEEQFRFRVFVDNVKEIARLQKTTTKTKFAISKVSDRLLEELAGTVKPAATTPFVANPKQNSVPQLNENKRVKVNAGQPFTWQGTNRVTYVKDQESCGGCWAFASAAVAESAWNSGNSLSPQQLIDCLSDQNGCNGGWPATVLSDMIGQFWEGWSDYPYVGYQNSQCMQSSSLAQYTYNYQVGTADSIDYNTAFSNILSYGTVAVAINANSAFQSYSGGVIDIDTCDDSTVNHAVSAVGYAYDDNGDPYYIVKNSWGPSWGINGFVYIRADTNACNINFSHAWLQLS
eukprot:ANDGO_02347.mRNA.1 Viral cathepsin